MTQTELRYKETILLQSYVTNHCMKRCCYTTDIYNKKTRKCVKILADRRIIIALWPYVYT